MKVGILGSGFMGRTHARAYAKMKGVEVAAISSLHLEKAETMTAARIRWSAALAVCQQSYRQQSYRDVRC